MSIRVIEIAKKEVAAIFGAFLDCKFSDETYYQAGVASEFTLLVDTTCGDKNATASLYLNGRLLNDPSAEHDLAERLRTFVQDLKALHEFKLADDIKE